MENISKEASKEAKKVSKGSKKDPDISRAEKIIAKYKGIKNRINTKPAIETHHDQGSPGAHTAGDDNDNN